MPNWWIIALFFSLVACTPNQDGTGSAASTPANTEAPSEPDILETAQSLLQGTWKRQSYPHGTIEFDGGRVKFTAGEGLAEPPEFTDYELKDTCPDAATVQASPLDYDFVIVHGGSNCEAIKMDGNRFTIFYVGSDEGVEYARE